MPSKTLAAFLLLLVALTAFSVTLVAMAQPVPLDRADQLTGIGVKAEAVTYRGRKAVRVVEGKTNGGGGIAVLPGAEFRNGTVDVMMAGLPAAGAAEGARGFVGVAFRVQRDPGTFECFYLRPTNGRADDQLRRNHSTQYISEPAFPWQKLRQENPGVYESYVDLEPGAWTPVRIVVDGMKAQLFVHGAAQPALIVNDLKLGDATGAVALWIGPGTEAYFADVSVTRR